MTSCSSHRKWVRTTTRKKSIQIRQRYKKTIRFEYCAVVVGVKSKNSPIPILFINGRGKQRESHLKRRAKNWLRWLHRICVRKIRQRILIGLKRHTLCIIHLFIVLFLGCKARFRKCVRWLKRFSLIQCNMRCQMKTSESWARFYAKWIFYFCSKTM